MKKDRGHPFWLSRANDGRYMLTGHRPIIKKVEKCDYQDLYVVPGDNVGIRGMCPIWSARLWKELPILGMCRVRLSGEVVGDTKIL